MAGWLDRATVVVEASRQQVINRLRGAITSPVLSASEWRQSDAEPLVYVGDPSAAAIPLQDLAWLHSSLAGVDNLTSTSLPESLIVTRTIGRMPDRIAEYVLTWMLADYQHVRQILRQQENHEWQRLAPEILSGSTMVLFGVGQMGSRVAEKAALNGISVHGVAATPRPIPGCSIVTDVCEGIEASKDADWIVSTLPLTSKTTRFFNRSFFEVCNKAHFINVGRGKTVDMADLIEALETRHLRAATIDVFPEEPLSVSNRLWDIPNLVITSHQAGITTDDDVINDFLACWSELARKQSPSLLVNLSREY